MLLWCSHSLDIDQILYILQSGYQLIIESYNKQIINPSTGGFVLNLIDLIVVEIPACALGQYSFPQTYFGEVHEDLPITVNLSYSLGCSPNYTLCTIATVLQCVLEYECINGKPYSIDTTISVPRFSNH